ncbi:MAG: arginine--tRNA ligase, partial [Thermoguttaceae bacterium]
IGNSLTRILKFLGHDVITDNHIGDWGTQFGMIIYGYRNFLDQAAFEKNPVAELSRLYRHVRQLVDNPAPDATEDVGALVLRETAKLHGGDAENIALWKSFIPICMEEMQRVYDRLGISFDHTLGESYYQPFLADIVSELLEKGIAEETDGAIGIFLEGHEVPMLIRKKDGAFLYSTTDLATIQYRMKEFSPDVILYVVDFRQSHHFEQLFTAVSLIAEKVESFRKGKNNLELAHIKFGTVLGEDGKAFKTRSGDTIGLEYLLDEAEKRAYEIVTSNDDAKPAEMGRLTESERKETARRIGLGALIYADLSQNRESDYVFSFDKMLAMNGNTATYMQYAYARVRSIFSKGEIDPASLKETVKSGADIALTSPEERALALEILKFDEALESTVRDYRPNILTAYLFELANRYSNFFEKCPVLRAEDAATKTSRLVLCDLTARTIRKGLQLLGIETVDRM